MIAKVKGIVWDTDGVDVKELPISKVLVVDNEDDDIAGILSDMYGYCVETIGSVEFEEPITLSSILTKYFGVKRPFSAKTNEFTRAGSVAYGKLVILLGDVSSLTDESNVGKIIEKLDEISDEKYY